MSEQRSHTDMDAETLEALRGSIAKWEAIAAGHGEERGTENCPLCAKFYRFSCRGCPVSCETGEAYCNGSPYDEWSDLLPEEVERQGLWPNVIYKARTEHARAVAQKEVDFLKSLLPAKARTDETNNTSEKNK